MYVCMYVCIHIYIIICVCISLSLSLSIYIYIYTCYIAAYHRARTVHKSGARGALAESSRRFESQMSRSAGKSTYQGKPHVRPSET